MAEESYRYYVTWIDQGIVQVFGSFITTRDRPVENESDINELKRIAGAKDAKDQHIIVLDWKRIS